MCFIRSRLNLLALMLVLAFVFVAASIALAGGTTIVWQDRGSPFQGTTVSAPAGWAKGDDSPFSLDVLGPGWNKSKQIGERIVLLADPMAAEGGPFPSRLGSVGTDPASLVVWLRHNPKLVVSAPTIRTIAGGIDAVSVDMHVSPSAGKDNLSCAVACWSYFAYRGGCCYGTGSATYERLYLASVGRGTHRHVLAISVEGNPHAAFLANLPAASSIVEALQIPRRLTR
jgi:hypothetical protein